MSHLLRGLPALATVGIGSLPFAGAHVAARHAVRAYDVPFCPQLPLVDGDMIHEWLGSDPARCGWTPDRDRELPRAWDALRAELRLAPPVHAVVKLQVTGPLTLAAALDGEGLRREPAALSCLAREIASWLAANVASQLDGLRDLGLRGLLVIDEPGLAFLGAGAGVEHVWDPLVAIAPAWGLHVCGPVPWALVDAAAPDLISFDLVRYGLDAGALEALPRQFTRGGSVALGVLDAALPGGAARTAARAIEALRVLAARIGCTLPDLAHAVLLSPTCGTGRGSERREQLVATQLAEAAALTRAQLRPAVRRSRASARLSHPAGR